MTDAGQPSELFQLTESTCIALLGVQHVGRLIVPGDDPYVIPVNYSAVDGAIVFRTERRPVIDAIDGRPVVFEVDMFDDRSKSGWSVVGSRPCPRHHRRHRRRSDTVDRLHAAAVGARRAGLRHPHQPGTGHRPAAAGRDHAPRVSSVTAGYL